MNRSMDRRKIVRHDAQSSNSTTAGDHTYSLSIDLIINILLRLPVKSIAICSCVSKQWSSLLRYPYLSLIRPLTRPRLFLALQYGSKWHFFSCPHDFDENVSVVLTDYHMGFSGDWYKNDCQSVHGLIFLVDKGSVNGKIPVICNPSTGQQLFLPKPRARNLDLRSLLGYDPIEKEYKVLCMTVSRYRNQTNSREHQVLTLGKRKLSWRKIKCSFPHYPEKWIYGICRICINGVLYYKARFDMSIFIACFDVRSEKFSYIESPKGFWITPESDLMNYKGKLGVLTDGYVKPRELWVLNDTEKDKQWKHISDWPSAPYVFQQAIWISDRDEIGWIPRPSNNTFYVWYYNLETAIYRRVEIKGIQEKLGMGQDILYNHFTFIDHVENLMLL